MTEHLGYLQGSEIVWYGEMIEPMVPAEPSVKHAAFSLTGESPRIEIGVSPLVSFAQVTWDAMVESLTAGATADTEGVGELLFESVGLDLSFRQCVTGKLLAAEVGYISDGATVITPSCGEFDFAGAFSWEGIAEDFRFAMRRARHFRRLPRVDPVRETEAVGAVAP